MREINMSNPAQNATSQKSTPEDMKLRRLALFSSGVGFFEHKGDLEGDTEFSLPFDKDAVDDVLKSIVISDPEASPTVSYHSEDTLKRTLKGLSIDLLGKNYIAELLKSLKGAEIEVCIPDPLKGKILLVEYRFMPPVKGQPIETNDRDTFLSLFTGDGVRVISLREINGFSFCDPKINADVNRALDLILQSRDSGTRDLTIKLPGNKSRNVSLSYVVPTPVWKVSYRLDLSKEAPFLQGWAIVDNDTDTDWEQVELSLITGKPVSFIQNLYAPYHMSRPTLPLAIAGVAEAKVYDSGVRQRALGREEAISPLRTGSAPAGRMAMSARTVQLSEENSYDSIYKTFSNNEDLSTSEDVLYEDMVDTAHGRAVGDQFEFTIKNPVSLQRRQSAMLPLVEGPVHAEKMLVFSGGKVSPGVLANPAVGAEIVNNTDMKLPAGPITVYDSGTYAGDALIEFFPEDEKRIISYGEDLSVTGSYTYDMNRIFSAVSVKEGLMTTKNREQRKRTYTFRNASGITKQLIVEQPFSSSRAVLIAPSEYKEKTSNLYRFELNLPPGETTLDVCEEELQETGVVLSKISTMMFKGYAANQDYPEAVRAYMEQAIKLVYKIRDEKEKLVDFENRLGRLLKEQERIRKNLSSAGSQSQQGQKYLSRLAEQDNDIDETNKSISDAEQSVKDAQHAYDQYIQDMVFID